MLGARSITTSRFLVAALVLGAAGLLADVRPGTVRADEGAWKPVTVLFTRDVQGQLEPCG